MKKRQELATQMQIEAVKDAREQINGSACGYDLSTHGIIRKGFTSSKIPINTNDFSLEYYGTFIGSAGAGKETIIGDPESILYGVGTFRAYARNLEESYRNSLMWLLFEKSISNDNTGDSVLVNYCHPDDNPFHVVITRQGTTVKVYIEGVLKATREQSAIKDMGMFPLCIANASDARQARVFNYALSADEVTALYNNGKPEEYVLPSKYKYDYLINRTLALHKTNENPKDLLFTSNENNFHISWSEAGSDKARPTVSLANSDGLSSDTYILVEFEYSINRGVLYLQSICNTSIRVSLTGNGKFSRVIKTDAQRIIYIRFDGETYANVSADLSNISLRKCMCIAEYLPQNLISTSDGEMNATTAVKWLDSAKQLPLNDEYLEPLLESIGGYDLTASGEPEIVYKPNTIKTLYIPSSVNNPHRGIRLGVNWSDVSKLEVGNAVDVDSKVINCMIFSSWKTETTKDLTYIAYNGISDSITGSRLSLSYSITSLPYRSSKYKISTFNIGKISSGNDSELFYPNWQDSSWSIPTYTSFINLYDTSNKMIRNFVPAKKGESFNGIIADSNCFYETIEGKFYEVIKDDDNLCEVVNYEI